MKRENKHVVLFLMIFIALAFLFCLYTKEFDFHDAPEYITSAKEFAGLSIAQVHTGHSSLYPFFISLFLKIFPYYLTIKLVNISWLILIGLILYLTTKDMKSFILWMFSPLVWQVSITITPVFIVSLSLISAYFFLMQWEKTYKKIYFILSGLSLSLGPAVWPGALVFDMFFIITFFFNKRVKELAGYIICTLPFIILGFIFDTVVFGFSLYSYVRTFGSVVARRLGATTGTAADSFVIREGIRSFLRIVFFISPLAFFVYKLNFKNYKRELVFILLSGLFVIYYHIIFYPIIVAPFLILILSKTLSKKQVMTSVVISIPIIIFLTYPYFLDNSENIIIAKDLRDVYHDFGYEKIIAGDITGSFSTEGLNAAYWYGTKPELLWASDYKMFLNNQTDSSNYMVTSKSKINNLRILEISAKVKRDTSLDDEFEKLPLLDYKDGKVPDGFKKIKCYRKTCIYEKRK
jgi:hypothetical protein